MRNVLLLIAAITGTLGMKLYAATDASQLEVSYETHEHNYVEDEQPTTQVMTLYVGEQSSLFAGAMEELLKQQRDSLAQAAIKELGLPIGGMGTMMSSSVQMMGGEGYRVLKNYPSAGQLTLVDAAGGRNYRVEEPMPDIEWELLEGDTVIADYACQKAKAQWRGRTWTAWYTIDLPYSEGPWKLCGLPGLILAANDDSGNFGFECISIKKGDSHPIALDGKTEKCSLKELQTMKTRAAKDPVSFVLESMGLGGMLGSGNVQVIAMDGSSGQQASIPSRTPIFMEQIDR